MQRTVTLISRHARPLCENAHTHGWRVAAVDGFNDWDTARFAALLTPGGFGETPEAFLRAWESAPEPLLFGAPVEAAPDILAGAARKKRVLNAPTEAVMAARDFHFLREMARDGVRLPLVSIPPNSPNPPNPPKAPWVVKSAKTAGGTGIRPDDGFLGKDEYRQEFIHGESIGALFFSRADRCDFLGAALHLNHGFLYGGGIFPALLGSGVTRVLGNFGARVSAASGMTGWWGADFILNNEAVWLLEINPRPTATAALFGKLRGVDLVAAQMSPNAAAFDRAEAAGVVGNMVVYARNDFTFHGSAAWFDQGGRDIPHEGSLINQGAPVLTLHAEAATATECRASLERQAMAAHTVFSGAK